MASQEDKVSWSNVSSTPFMFERGCSSSAVIHTGLSNVRINLLPLTSETRPNLLQNHSTERKLTVRHTYSELCEGCNLSRHFYQRLNAPGHHSVIKSRLVWPRYQTSKILCHYLCVNTQNMLVLFAHQASAAQMANAFVCSLFFLEDLLWILDMCPHQNHTRVGSIRAAIAMAAERPRAGSGGQLTHGGLESCFEYYSQVTW